MNQNLPKVVHITAHDHGGAGNAAFRLHQGLLSLGVESSMLVLAKNSSDSKVRQIGSIDSAAHGWLQILNQYPARRSDLEIFTGAPSDIDLRDYEEFQNADIVNLHWAPGILNHQALHAMTKDKKVVWTLHDMNAFTGGCHYNWECRKFETECTSCPQLGSSIAHDHSYLNFHHKLTGYASAHIHLVTPSAWLGSEAAKSALCAHMPKTVISNGCALDVFQAYDPQSVRQHLNIDPNRKIILFGCASLGNKRKGFRYLQEAASLIANQQCIPAPLFCFFGDVPHDFSFPAEALPLGSIKDESTLAAVYSLADIFVIPSLQDNLPNVVPESLACGTPVVGFNVGGIPEMIQHQRTGYIVPIISAEALAAGIVEILGNTNKTMRYHCRVYAEEHFSLQGQAKKYLELYSSLLSPGEPLAMQKQEKTKSLKLVNLGCGSRFHTSWENYDIVPTDPSVRELNFIQSLPLPDNYADAIYHSHVLEHFPHSLAQNFIHECLRVLTQGGVLRIAVPDLETIINEYTRNLEGSLRGESQAEQNYDWIMMELFDQMVRNRSGGNMLDWWKRKPVLAEDYIISRVGDEAGKVIRSIGADYSTSREPENPTEIGIFRLSGEIHQWMYDRFSLARLLTRAGFKHVSVVNATDSLIPNFQSYQLDTDSYGRTRKPDSLFMEGVK